MIGIVAIATVIVVSVGVFAWIVTRKSQPVAESGDRTVVGSDASGGFKSGEFSSDALPRRETYRNEKYGFQVYLPEGWENYRAVERDKNAEDNLSGVVFIDFALPSREGVENSGYWSGMVPVGTVGVWTKEAWNRKKTQCLKRGITPGCPDEHSALGNNEQYFFDYTSSQDVPSDIAGLVVNADYFQTYTTFFSPPVPIR